MDIALAVIGRLHNLTLHFPIALVIAIAVLELPLRGRLADDKRKDVVRRLLVWVAIASVVAVVSGLAYAETEGLRGQALIRAGWHRNWAIATTVLIVAAAVAARRPRMTRALFPLICAAVVGVTLTGHIGGELVHGANYFMEPFEERDGREDDDDGPTVASDGDEAEAKARERHPEGVVPDKPDYQTHIKPILQRSCTKCHGPEKRKSGLRLDKKRYALKGGETGPALVPGDIEESLLIKAVTLAPDDDDVMPPKGKLLAQSEIDTLKKWIAAGADWPDDPDAPK